QILGEKKREEPRRRSSRIAGECLKQCEIRKRKEPKEKREEVVKFVCNEPITKRRHDMDASKSSEEFLGEWLQKANKVKIMLLSQLQRRRKQHCLQGRPVPGESTPLLKGRMSKRDQ
ncbi:hypothetical protein Dimus_011016, partial [Dionaea muscipula]